MTVHLQSGIAVMPRIKTIADDEVLDTAGGILRRKGPEALTFAAVASATKLSPATLVQRFGSRRTLLRAILIRLWDNLDAATAAADARHPLNPAGAVALLVNLWGG
jgi:AcrR family transcriptional regulator